MLRKTPGFTLIALVTLAIGIGVHTAVFTVLPAADCNYPLQTAGG